MPELFRQYGFVFLFFSHEHEPIHVHVRGHNGDAKYVWDGDGFTLDSSHGIKASPALIPTAILKFPISGDIFGIQSQK